ncbi:MAG: polysaccharide deacetylase family protein [Flavobacteriales bacterium]|jgi:peptidoglycan/xylan/chitin deacetylase (PgdA/CDA1 family)|nr:polysaccharide deacetylase family protein [Flavobacteriales bacterium]
MSTGAFVISLDFELFWGMRDKRTLEEYGAHIRGVRSALPRMLDAFERHGVKATFATVGLLYHSELNELMRSIPAVRPSYRRATLSPYNGHLDTLGANEQEDPHHYGASLIRLLLEHPQHEVACHTFSHYYCLEEGQTADQFREDLRAAERAAEIFGVKRHSLVFPRNQFNAAYLAICREEGIVAYRGNETSWLYAARNAEEESLIRRGLRLLDTWLPLSGANVHAKPTGQELPINVPASRFLRPFDPRTAFLEPLKLRRITTAMDQAAKEGGIYHLWWHPHNFGAHLEQNLRSLDHVLAHYGRLHDRQGMMSMTMQEVAAQALGRRKSDP